jgi:hypothetical protein
MPIKPITQRQRYWLEHLNTAAISGSSLVDYAAAHQLKARHLYAWKTRLIVSGHLPDSRKGKKPGFVSVVPTRNATTASLVMPNGFRVELQGAVDRALLQDLIHAAREAS